MEDRPVFSEKFLDGGTIFALRVEDELYLDYLPHDGRDAHARRMEVKERLKKQHNEYIRSRLAFARKLAGELG